MEDGTSRRGRDGGVRAVERTAALFSDTRGTGVASTARDAYRWSNGSLDVTAGAAAEAAPPHHARVTDPVHGGGLTVTPTRHAPTVPVDRTGRRTHLADRSATTRADLELP